MTKRWLYEAGSDGLGAMTADERTARVGVERRRLEVGGDGVKSPFAI